MNDKPTSRGFAVMYPDGLCILTASTTEYRSMINALWYEGIQTCQDPKCDCAEKAFASEMPGCAVVSVNVVARHDS